MAERGPAQAPARAFLFSKKKYGSKSARVQTGRVRVQTTTENVEEIARATLDEDVVEVTRIPVGREVDQPPQVRTEDGVVIVPVLEEVLIVEKRLVLKEELHIRRSVSREDVEVPITLRKQRAVIERLGPEGQPDIENP